MNAYEGMYIFPEQLSDEQLDTAIKQAGEEIEKLGGKLESVTRLGKRTFAQRMDKQEAGQYVVMTFQLDGSRISALHARYRLAGDVFRVQIVRAKPVAVAAV